MGEQASYPKVAQLRSVEEFRTRLRELGLDLPVDEACLTAAAGSPLAEPIEVGGFHLGNRWCIHPMEGWDANSDGSPSEHTLRRWRRFGLSGAKLIWGGEAAAVRLDGRANPNQLTALAQNRSGLAALLAELKAGHREQTGSLDGLLVGLQLTHSGRFSRPNEKTRAEPRIAYHHPLLDEKFEFDPADDSVVWTDAELEELIDEYVAAARVASEVGFQFVGQLGVWDWRTVVLVKRSGPGFCLSRYRYVYQDPSGAWGLWLPVESRLRYFGAFKDEDEAANAANYLGPKWCPAEFRVERVERRAGVITPTRPSARHVAAPTKCPARTRETVIRIEMADGRVEFLKPADL